nr:immunoglobulin light chain junction region [Macaca mulatta]
CQHTYGTPRTF